MSEYFFWLIILFPLIILIFDQKNDKKKARIIMNIKKKKGMKLMNYEILKKRIGDYCTVNTLEYVEQGIILSVNESWLEIEVNEKKDKRIELINLDYVEKISIDQ